MSASLRNDRRTASRTARDYSILVPEYGRGIVWERPRDHVVKAPGTATAAVEPPQAVSAEQAAPAESESWFPARFGPAMAVLVFALAVGILWPVQFVLVALLLGGGLLIDDALRDAVPGHARNLRRAQRPVPWVLAGGSIAASLVWPEFAAQIVLGLLVLAAAAYLGAEALATTRRLRQVARDRTTCRPHRVTQLGATRSASREGCGRERVAGRGTPGARGRRRPPADTRADARAGGRR